MNKPLASRLEKLEQRQPAHSYSGVDRFIWHGPEDDEAMAEAKRAAQEGGRLLILRTVTVPPPRMLDAMVISDDCGRPLVH